MDGVMKKFMLSYHREPVFRNVTDIKLYRPMRIKSLAAVNLLLLDRRANRFSLAGLAKFISASSKG